MKSEKRIYRKIEPKKRINGIGELMQVLPKSVRRVPESRHNPRVMNVFNVKLRNTENPMDVNAGLNGIKKMYDGTNEKILDYKTREKNVL
jgi:hypothetical protein